MTIDYATSGGILDPANAEFEFHIPVVVIGGGGCGLTAALAVREAGLDVVVLERDALVEGTTAMSTGLIPAAGTKSQAEKGIDDSAQRFASDMLGKARGQTDEHIVRVLAEQSARTVEWLIEDHGIKLSLVEGFLYPGHSALRMYGTPQRTGEELSGMLVNACINAGVDILTDALVTDLFADADGRIQGLRIKRPDGALEDIGCDALVLACCGFAGNRDMLTEYIPEILNAEFFGHPGNQGDAIRWGRALGAKIGDIGSYQGHGGLAAGYGIPILWPLIMEGGIQVNAEGERFANEAKGYSEHAVEVVAQPGGFAWMIYDERLHQLMQEFGDYRNALETRAVRSAKDISSLADITSLPEASLSQTLSDVAAMVADEKRCPFGRDFTGKAPLGSPLYAVKVNGAIFHTQGGLVVDEHARVVNENDQHFPNLYAGGGAARGISGPSSWGYMAGNGLLTATTFGRLAGEAAAAQIKNA